MPARMRRACSRPACWTVQRFLGWRSTTESLPCGGRSGTPCCDQRSSAVSDGDGRALPSYDDLLQEVPELRAENGRLRDLLGVRSEEQRVGQELITTCSSRWTPVH